MNTSVGRRPRGAVSTISPLHSTLAPIARNASRCGSRRRRPITSPPGGGITARPKRASSGPASRNEARIGSASSRSISISRARRRRTAPARWRRARRPRRRARAGSSSIASTSRMRGTLRTSTSSSVRSAGGEDRQRAVLVPGRDHRAGQRDAAFDDELLHELYAPPTAPRQGSRDRAPGKRNSHLPVRFAARARAPARVTRTGRRAPRSTRRAAPHAQPRQAAMQFRCSTRQRRSGSACAIPARHSTRTYVRIRSVRSAS